MKLNSRRNCNWWVLYLKESAKKNVQASQTFIVETQSGHAMEFLGDHLAPLLVLGNLHLYNSLQVIYMDYFYWGNLVYWRIADIISLRTFLIRISPKKPLRYLTNSLLVCFTKIMQKIHATEDSQLRDEVEKPEIFLSWWRRGSLFLSSTFDTHSGDWWPNRETSDLEKRT